MFEVSVRTIYRDIESINGAGIPIVTYQGSGGGIGLMEGYRLDRNVLTDRELADIFSALQSVSSYGGTEHTLLMEKISSVIPPSQTADPAYHRFLSLGASAYPRREDCNFKRGAGRKQNCGL